MDSSSNKTLLNTGNDIFHIIPFDSGLTFFDELSLNNKDSLSCINMYLDLLSDKINKSGFELFSNISAINDNGDYKVEDKIMCAEAICYIKLITGLYCYILQSGIAVFLCADFNSSKFSKSTMQKLSKQSQCLQLGYRKVYGQKALLNPSYDTKVFSKEKELMYQLMDDIWATTKEVARKYPKKYLRKNSSNLDYKHHGFSYVLSIYLINKDTISQNELLNLMYSSYWRQVLDEEKWPQIEDDIKKTVIKTTNYIDNGNNYQIHFSWTGVAIVSPKSFNCFKDVLDDSVVSNVVKAENYVQSRWFLGDSCLDNFKLDKKINLEKIISIQNELEFIEAELDNTTSANMTSFYKKVTAKIVETSEIKSLYSSVIRQVKVQASLSRAKIEKSKRRSLFVSSILVSIFTAFSMYKSINEFLNSGFDTRNVILFITTCLLAFGLVVFEYINSKRS